MLTRSTIFALNNPTYHHNVATAQIRQGLLEGRDERLVAGRQRAHTHHMHIIVHGLARYLARSLMRDIVRNEHKAAGVLMCMLRRMVSYTSRISVKDIQWILLISCFKCDKHSGSKARHAIVA